MALRLGKDDRQRDRAYCETLVGQAEQVRNAITNVHLDLSHDITTVSDGNQQPRKLSQGELAKLLEPFQIRPRTIRMLADTFPTHLSVGRLIEAPNG